MTALLDDAQRAEVKAAAVSSDLASSAALLDSCWSSMGATSFSRDLVPEDPPARQLRRDLIVLTAIDAKDAPALRTWLEQAELLSASQAARDRLRNVRERLFGLGMSRNPDMPAHLPQRIIFEDKTVDFGFLAGGHAAGAAVGCLRVAVVKDGVPAASEASGTAWMIAPRHALTCLHVIEARAPEAPRPAEPDLRAQALGSKLFYDWTSSALHGPPRAVTALVAYDAALDVALLELESQAAGPAPLTLSTSPLQPSATDKATAVNIIQFPRGREKRVGLRGNALFSVTTDKLHYFTDTDEGASGAPVFDDAWRVIGMHRGAVYEMRATFMGKQVGYVNYGFQIAPLIAWLKTVAPSILP